MGLPQFELYSKIVIEKYVSVTFFCGGVCVVDLKECPM